ncbi:MAG: RNA polymerase factor sigma-54 [Pseudomonadota bacterium]
MAVQLSQHLKLTQQLIMTPQLQQAIKLLQLSRLELLDAINQELQQNPVLEVFQDELPQEGQSQGYEGENEENTGKPVVSEDSLKSVKVEERTREDFDWSNYMEEFNPPGSSYSGEECDQDAPKYDNVLSRTESLTEHIQWQLLLVKFSEAEENIGMLIAGNLNSDGYLQITIEEIAASENVSAEFVQSVLDKMQNFDPSGVCARDLQECLLIQARQIGIKDPVFFSIIENHLKNLENKNYKAIAKALNIPLEDVEAAVDVITRFEPKPGRIFNNEDPVYISPDIYVYKVGIEYVILLNDDGLPKLRVNSYYKHTISNKDGGVTDTTRDYIQNKLKSAIWLIRSIHQRQRTIYKVTESIVRRQKEFLERGINYLKPMILRDVADDIGMHESTVSRVTTNKYVHTPQGIFELKFFFSNAIKQMSGGGDGVASASVKDKIRLLILAENTLKPYSDKKIVAMLKDDNIDIARRTVAKYREVLGVLPSSKRKRGKGK